MKGSKAMDALRVFPSSKVERAGMPVKRAPHGASCGGMPIKQAPHGASWGNMPMRRVGMPISREDPRYQTLIRGFNLRWVGNPRFVQVVDNAQQVREVVQSAVSDKMRITVRSGGHCYEDFVSANDDGVIIDLSGLNGVYEENGMIVVEGGCTLWDVYLQMYKKWGLTIPGGSCYSVGVGGHVCGGGFGLLSRLHGLTVDYLAGVEVVVVDQNRQAHIVRAFHDDDLPEKRDLFWAHTGGGGGNFGVVTKYFFQNLPQAPQEAWLAHMAWNWNELDEVKFKTIVQNYDHFWAEHSGVDSEYKGLFTLLALTHISANQIVLTAQYVGNQPSLLQEFMRQMQAHSAQTDTRRLPWLYATQNLDASGPNQRSKCKSAYMRKPFPERQINVMFKWLTDHDYSNPHALLEVDSYGGQINAIDKEATAAVHRDSILKLQYQTFWTEEEEDSYHLKWIRGFYNEMYGEDGPLSDDHVDGCFINYPDVDAPRSSVGTKVLADPLLRLKLPLRTLACGNCNKSNSSGTPLIFSIINRVLNCPKSENLSR